jgi:hypothetical protein
MSNRHFHVTNAAFIGHPSRYHSLYITHPLCHHVAYNLLPISTSLYQHPRCCCSLSFSMQRHCLRFESLRNLQLTSEDCTNMGSEYRRKSVLTVQAKHFFIIHSETFPSKIKIMKLSLNPTVVSNLNLNLVLHTHLSFYALT